MSDNEGRGGGGGASDGAGDGCNSSVAENCPQLQRSTDAAPDAAAEDAPSPTSDSTQWPSAPSTPASQDNNVTRLQDILDRALRDPFSSHPEVAAHLKSNVELYCRLAAEKIYEADVLLVVTGAGFSADSGLATYLDVADIEAYRSKGWRYRDLCRPPAFGDFDDLNGGGNGEGEVREEGDGENGESKRQDSNAMEPYRIGGRGGIDNEEGSENHSYQEELHPERPSDEDDIHHPQYFYGFWGQCSNDYRRVSPHDGYDIIARWGRDKNVCATGTGDDAIIERSETEVATDIRRITHMLELGDDGSESSHDSGSFFRFKEDDEDEPYYVSPTERAGAFFVFTSNVDAHSFDVFKSHEIRECHGNVEMWQCHNFACGTNATVMHGGSLDGSDCNGDNNRNIGDKTEQEEKWQRRLWRLPMDHHFTVDCNTMQAPREKTMMGTESTGSDNLPASKRRKSSMTEREDANNDTATALGGLMEDTLRNHLARETEQSQQRETRALESDGEANMPAHVGDVHGKPRLFPLRHMHPPTGAATNGEMDGGAQNYFLPIAANENWPRCPRCQEAARPAVLMFDDLDWVYNLKQEQRWQRWTQSLLKLCKWRGRGVEGIDNESVSTASDDNISEKGWEDVSEPSTEKKTDPMVNPTPAVTQKSEGGTADQSTVAKTDQAVDVTMPTEPQDAAEKEDTDNPKPPVKVAILEIGCGYNVPTCRVIAERLTGELTVRGGDATLIRINPTHPESDDHGADDCIISIMEKGLAALKLIDDCYRELSGKSSSSTE